MLPHLHLLFSPTKYDIHEELCFWYNFYQAHLDVKRMAVTTDKAAHYIHLLLQIIRMKAKTCATAMLLRWLIHPCPFWAGKNPKHNPPFLGLLRRWTWRPPSHFIIVPIWIQSRGWCWMRLYPICQEILHRIWKRTKGGKFSVKSLTKNEQVPMSQPCPILHLLSIFVLLMTGKRQKELGLLP